MEQLAALLVPRRDGAYPGGPNGGGASAAIVTRLVRHAPYHWPLLVESHLTPVIGRVDTLRQIWALAVPTGSGWDLPGFAGERLRARQYSVNGERLSFAGMRPANGDLGAQDAIRQCILGAFARHEAHA